jgi:Ca2+-binding EF-hand superfamily protein
MTAVFFFGSIVGAIATSRFLWEKHMKALRSPRFEAGRMMRHFEDNLDLTEEQSKEITTILADHQAAIGVIRNDVRSQVEDEIESLRVEVESVLTPEQTEHWNQRFDDEKKRWLPPPHRGRRHGELRHGGRHRYAGHGPAYLLKNADSNDDGSITFEELNNFSTDFIKKRFDELDTDGDGILSGKEITEATLMPPWHSRQRFSM